MCISGNVMKTIKPLLLYEEFRYIPYRNMTPDTLLTIYLVRSPNATRVIFFQNTDLSMLPFMSLNSSTAPHFS